MDCHATDVARNDKRRCRAPFLAMTRIGCELHTDLSSRGECNDRGDPVIINLFAVANTVLWIATPLTWPAMTREDAGCPSLAMTNGETKVVQV